MPKPKQRSLRGVLPTALEKTRTTQIINGAAARARHIIATAEGNQRFAGKFVVEVRLANAFLRSHTKNTSTADQATTFLKAVAKIRAERTQ